MDRPRPVILVVEDELRLAGILGDYLVQSGFDSVHVDNGIAALKTAAEMRPDLIVLDIMLPGLDGISVCREIRKTSQVPIIMATARVEELDRLLGLELGADDYICKPFSPREVVARVKAVLRRSRPSPAEPPAVRFEIDDATQRIAVGGKHLDLTRTEFQILRLLASRPGRVYSRIQILELAYDDDQDVSDRVIDSHIKNLRRKIDQILPGVDAIHAVYGIGYRFEIGPAGFGDH